MNPCQEFEKRLPAYQEGLISGQDQKDLENHLHSCEPCRRALQDLNRTKDLLSRLPEVAPPPWFTQKVMVRVREEAAGERGLLRKLFYPLHIKIPLEAMASVLVVILAVYVFQVNEPETPLLRAPSESVSPVPKEFAYQEKGKETAPVPTAPAAPIIPPNLETKTAARSRLEKEPAARQLSGSGIPGDKSAEEKRAAAAGSSMPPARETPNEIFANKMEAPVNPAAPLKKMEPSESKPAPALGAVTKEKDRAQPRAFELLEEKGKSASGRSTVGPAAAFKSTPTGFTLRVRDVQEAAVKALDLLRQIGAKNVHQETRPEVEIITAAVASPTIPELLDQLNTLGEIQGKGRLPPPQEEPVAIRIEIRPITP